MKVGPTIAGFLVGLFAVAQLLQLLGFFGVGFSIAGIGITAGAFAISALCLKSAFKKTDG